MTLKQLHYLLGVLRAGSITAAAETLHVSQPAIGMHIRALEDELGVRLLTRHSRGVTPTEAGLLLARRGARVLGEVEAMRREVMKMGDGDGGEEAGPAPASPVSELLDAARILSLRDLAELAAGIVGLMAKQHEGGGA